MEKTVFAVLVGMDENGSFYKRLRYGVAWPASKTRFTRYVDLLQRRLGIAYTTTSSPGRFSLALEVGREKDIFVWTGKNDSKMERVEASYFSKSGSVDGPCIPTDFDAQYLC